MYPVIEMTFNITLLVDLYNPADKYASTKSQCIYFCLVDKQLYISWKKFLFITSYMQASLSDTFKCTLQCICAKYLGH